MESSFYASGMARGELQGMDEGHLRAKMTHARQLFLEAEKGTRLGKSFLGFLGSHEKLFEHLSNSGILSTTFCSLPFWA